MLEKDAPFVSFNCADYTKSAIVVWSHLWHQKGAYTGAAEDSPG